LKICQVNSSSVGSIAMNFLYSHLPSAIHHFSSPPYLLSTTPALQNLPIVKG
jgi:hypothetical protein